MSLSFTQDPTPSIILVMGVGGAGCNAVANMFQMGIHGVDFLICNTDSQVLGKNPVPKRLLIGQKLTGGLGCGANPERGKQAAQESTEEIRQVLQPPYPYGVSDSRTGRRHRHRRPPHHRPNVPKPRTPYSSRSFSTFQL